MSKYYTGIGTRIENLPKGIEHLMVQMGKGLAKRGYILRSGGASGADEAFERGCIEAEGAAEIFLPWIRFRDRCQAVGECRYYTLAPSKFEEARKFFVGSGIISHFGSMSDSSKKFHARNYYQVTGKTGQHSDFVVYYAPVNIKGEPLGGTRTAVMRARHLGIPTYNLGNEVELLAFENDWR